MELGSLADWVSAVSTALALVAALFAAWQAVRANRHQSAQIRHLRRADEEREAEQLRTDARRVAFWPGVRPEHPDSAFIYYANTSGLPIYDLTLTIEVRDQSVTIDYHSLGPEPAHRPMQRTRRLLADHVRDHGPVDWPAALANHEFRCTATFSDTAGTRWTRSSNGTLSTIGPNRSRH